MYPSRIVHDLSLLDAVGLVFAADGSTLWI